MRSEIVVDEALCFPAEVGFEGRMTDSILQTVKLADTGSEGLHFLPLRLEAGVVENNPLVSNCTLNFFVGHYSFSEVVGGSWPTIVEV